ncbi:hypothetical protein [Pseudomonas phage ZRG1]|nr:hypothetical protein [Pseudomonas phage ZRG1]
MATTIFNFPSDRQSGRTTLAVGMWQEMRVYGFECAYVLPTQKMARDLARRSGMPRDEVMGAYEFEHGMDGRRPRFVVLDGLELLGRPLRERLIDLAKARLQRLDGPTQLVLIP